MNKLSIKDVILFYISLLTIYKTYNDTTKDLKNHIIYVTCFLFEFLSFTFSRYILKRLVCPSALVHWAFFYFYFHFMTNIKLFLFMRMGEEGKQVKPTIKC